MQNTKSNLKKLYNNKVSQHIFGIAIFISYEWIFQLKGNTNASTLALALFYSFDIITFYLFGSLVLPKLSKTTFSLFIKIICGVFVAGFFSILHFQYSRMMYWLYEQPFEKEKLYSFIKLSVTRVIYISTGSFIYWHIRHSFRQKIEYYQMVERNDKLEIALLRAQLNPHLLFNVLTAVQNNLTVKYPETKNLMNALLDVFELAMKGSDPEKSSTLGDEIMMVERLVFLHEELGLNAELDIEVNDKVRSMKFPPKLLATLTENIFKHGDFSSGKPIAQIRLTVDTEYLIFSTENPVLITKHTTGNKIGLMNSVERLNRSFPNKYELDINPATTDTFSLHLTIKLI